MKKFLIKQTMRRIILILSLLPLLGVAILRSEAHGGGTPQLINGEAGPFLISVWTLPEPPTTAEAIHFTVALATPDESSGTRAGIVVLNANVQLTIESLEDGTKLVDSVTHEKATNRFFYETDLLLPNEGQWRATFDVNFEGQEGTASFDLDILPPPSNINWTLIGGITVAILGIGWFVWQSRQDEKSRLEVEKA